MPYPSYNPTLVLRDAVRAQGYDPGEVPLSIANSKYPMGFPPLGPLTGEVDTFDHPPCPTEAEALRPNPPGDVGVPKFTPHSSDQGM